MCAAVVVMLYMAISVPIAAVAAVSAVVLTRTALPSVVLVLNEVRKERPGPKPPEYASDQVDPLSFDIATIEVLRELCKAPITVPLSGKETKLSAIVLPPYRHFAFGQPQGSWIGAENWSVA